MCLQACDKFNIYHVPTGTQLIFNLPKLHRDPHVWSDPNEFLPERSLTILIPLRAFLYQLGGLILVGLSLGLHSC